MPLADVKTIVEIGGALVTSLGLIVAAVWTYFKFIKDRTFRPRVEISPIAAHWIGNNGDLGLHVSVGLRNIGSAKIGLEPRGTGVMIRRISENQDPAPAETRWEDFGVYEVFAKHQWIESGEAVADDLLIRLPIQPQVIEVQARVVLRSRSGNLTVHARRIFAPDESKNLGSQPLPLKSKEG